MLQLQTKNLNLLRTSGILAKYNIKASISKEKLPLTEGDFKEVQVITLSEGEISNELLTELCSEMEFDFARNFADSKPYVSQEFPNEETQFQNSSVDKPAEKIVYVDRPVEKIVYVDKPVEKIVYVDKPVEKIVEVPVYIDRSKHLPNVVLKYVGMSIEQAKMLLLVDINELIAISQDTSTTDEDKAKKILELFGFNLSQNGVQYLLEAILVSPKNEYFNLKTILPKIANSNSIAIEEVKRLIIARVKETIKQASTTEFIRMVNVFLRKEINKT